MYFLKNYEFCDLNIELLTLLNIYLKINFTGQAVSPDIHRDKLRKQMTPMKYSASQNLLTILFVLKCVPKRISLRSTYSRREIASLSSRGKQ